MSAPYAVLLDEVDQPRAARQGDELEQTLARFCKLTGRFSEDLGGMLEKLDSIEDSVSKHVGDLAAEIAVGWRFLRRYNKLRALRIAHGEGMNAYLIRQQGAECFAVPPHEANWFGLWAARGPLQAARAFADHVNACIPEEVRDIVRLYKSDKEGATFHVCSVEEEVMESYKLAINEDSE